MIARFRKELAKGAHSFVFNNRVYQVLDDITIYQYDSDTVYYKDLDF